MKQIFTWQMPVLVVCVVHFLGTTSFLLGPEGRAKGIAWDFPLDPIACQKTQNTAIP